MMRRVLLALALSGAVAALSAQIQIPGTGSQTVSVTGTPWSVPFLNLGGKLFVSSVAPTISSGFGTSPSIVSGTAATFRVNVGTGGAATSGVVGLPAALNGWNCIAVDITNNTVTRETSDTTSTVTFTAAAAWAASDVLLVQCEGF